MKKIVKIHPADNAIVALSDLAKGETVQLGTEKYILTDEIKAKHKFASQNLAKGDDIIMYGVLVGKAQQNIPAGGMINTFNVKHASNSFRTGERNVAWHKPDVSQWKNRTFNGYHRGDGSVGVANYWVVIPMVFCENRNLEVLQEALVKDLGYGRNKAYHAQAKQLIELYKAGSDVEQILNADIKVD